MTLASTCSRRSVAAARAPRCRVSPAGNGWGLEVPNWAVGVTVTFPVFEAFAVSARKRVEAQNELAERAATNRRFNRSRPERTRAQALMKAASDIARNTPAELKAATAAETRARARYSSGLASVTEVAEAQRLLAQAEADDAVARLGVWRALLASHRLRAISRRFWNNCAGRDERDSRGEGRGDTERCG